MFKQTVIKTDNLNSNFKDMLAEFLDKDEMKSLDIGESLSKTQKNAFELFKKGESLLVLGCAGTGKSMLIKTMQEYNSENDKKTMYLCGTTGISSYNIGGMTIHSWMGFGTGDKPVDTLIRRMLRNKSSVERLRNTDILVIDEISMLSASLFEKINILCQHFRKNKAFFGGIQVIFTGDLLQLLPIFNQNEALLDEPEDTRLIIESDIFNKHFNKKNNNIVILKENFRQQGDLVFMNLLLRLRSASQTDEDVTTLQTKCQNFIKENKAAIKKGIVPVHLVISNNKAQIINDTNMKKLNTPEYSYNSTFSSSGDDKDILDILKKELESQFKQKGMISLKLRKGTRVMLIKNLDVSLGLVNGSIGTITDFSSNKEPVVTFDNGQHRIIEKVEWQLDTNGNIVTGKQIPLILAYSITIHKSQSITLENAILDLEGCFCDHMVYVALSRLKSMQGVLLKSFNPNKITVNEKMKSFLDILA
jgi:ATP-dependent DNA helicase PIF1